MIEMKCCWVYGKILCLSLIFFLIGCVDPVEPVFENEEDLIYVDAFLSTTLGSSFVTVSESVLDTDRLKFEFLSDAEVVYRNVDTGAEIPLVLQTNAYIPPADFVAQQGSLWELDIILSDGREYKSSPERVTEPVAIGDIRATYNPELIFRENGERFLPGHFIAIDLDDPADRENYYFWRFTSFENLEVCQSCTNSIFRNGECQENPVAQQREYTVEYLCDRDCWGKRFKRKHKDLFR